MGKAQVVRLLYEVEAPTSLGVHTPWSPLRDELAKGEPVRVACSLSSAGLVVAYGDRFRLDLDGRSRALRTIDRERKEWRVLSWSPFERVPGRTVAAARATGAKGRCRVEGLAAATQRWEVDAGPLLIEAWALDARVASPSASRDLWNLLVPGCPADLGRAGPPTHVIVRRRDDPIRTLGSVRLVAVERGGELPVCDEPEGYGAPASAEPLEWRPRRQGDPRTRDDEEPDQAEAVSALAAQSRSGRLTPVDVAWSTAQATLDQAAGIVNAFAGTIDEFSDRDFVELGGRAGELGLVLDWWQHLEPRLRGGSEPELDDQVVAGIKKLFLAFKVANGESLPTLPDQLRRRYQREIRSAGLDATGRLLRFLDLIGAADLGRPEEERDAALRTVAEPEWDRFAAPRPLGLGLTELTRDVGPGEVTRVIVWNFRDVRVELGDRPLLEQLEFFPPTRDSSGRITRGGRVRAVFALDFLTASFSFETKPSGNWQSIVCAIFTFGLCAAFIAASGDGQLSLNRPRIAIDVTPRRPSPRGVVELRARLVRGASSMDPGLRLTSFNIAVDGVAAIADELDAWDGQIRDGILGALGDKIRELSLTTLFSWPAQLHMIDGPPVLGTDSDFRAGSASVRAVLANVTGLPLADGGRPEPDDLEPMGVALSRRYLAAWAREHVASYPADEELDIDLAAEIGIELADPARLEPATRPLPPPGDRVRLDRRRRRSSDEEEWPIDDPRDRLPGLVEDCEEPPSFGPSYRNRLTLYRRALEVALPNGPGADEAGALTIEYRIRFEPVKLQLTHVPRVIQHEVCYPLDVGDGLPIEQRIRYLDTIAAIQVAGRGLPEGATARQVAEQLAVIERARIARAFDGDEFLGVPGIVRDRPVVDPPPDGPGRPPRPPEPPGGADVRSPGLPTEVCEPPHCEWFSGISVTSLGTYVDAALRVELPIVVGLHPGGGVASWLPEVTLRGDPQKLRVINLGELRVDNEFEQADLFVLASVLQRIVREDAEGLLAGTSPTAQRPTPAAERLLLPSTAQLFLVIPEVLQRVVVFRDARLHGTRYRFANGLVHWPLAVEERFTELVH